MELVTCRLQRYQITPQTGLDDAQVLQLVKRLDGRSEDLYAACRQLELTETKFLQAGEDRLAVDAEEALETE